MGGDRENPHWMGAALMPAGRRIAREELPPKVRDALPAEVDAYVEIDYKQWDGPRGEWHDSMGKYGGRVDPLDGGEPVASCNEIEVAKLLRSRLGYEAFFFTTFPIPDGSTPDQPDWCPWTKNEKAAPDWLRKLDDEIRSLPWWPKKASGKPEAGGMPDVVAWDPNAAKPRETAVFVECKGLTEGMRKHQSPWVAAAIELGVPADRFALALRPF
jgi:hypothetical protein